MKKITQLLGLLILAVFILGFTSCNKEGTYNPSKKLSKIYQEYKSGSSSTGKLLKESWTWNKKQLTQIDYYASDGKKIIYSSIFKYDGKQVSEIKSGNTTMKFVYEKSKLDNIEISVGEIIHSSIVIAERDGKNITKMVYNNFSENQGKNHEMIIAEVSSVIRLFISEEFGANMYECLKDAQAEAKGLPREVYLKYDKNGNVTEEKWVPDARGTITYEYDGNKNPLAGAFFLDTESHGVFSKNNIMKKTVNKSVQTYDYIYEKK